MKLTLLGFTVPQAAIDEILASDAHMPTQTHTFAWSVVESLRDAGAGVTLLSAKPLTSFPGNPSILVGGGRFNECGIDGVYLPFVNLTVAKHLTRFISAGALGGALIHRWRPDAVLVHGVHSPFLLAAQVYRRVLGIPVVTILTDPPGVVLPTDSRLVAGLKQLDRAVVRWLLRGQDGVIALTTALADHYAPGAPVLVMEGIVSALPQTPAVTGVGADVAPQATIVYAGGLSRAYGVDRLVEAVLRLPETNVRLKLFGRGELEALVSQLAAGDPRVEPPRFTDRSEILHSYAKADVLVQPRPVEQDFVRYSFPSKLMEYLASGTPVVTTRLPGIPADYSDHVEWADPDDADGLSEAIRRVLALTPAERRERGARARDFVWRTRGRANQGRRMRDFLEGLAHRP